MNEDSFLLYAVIIFSSLFFTCINIAFWTSKEFTWKDKIGLLIASTIGIGIGGVYTYTLLYCFLHLFKR